MFQGCGLECGPGEVEALVRQIKNTLSDAQRRERGRLIRMLGESLNGSLRESAAHFSGRDVRTEVGSRNLFPLPSESSAQSAVKAPPRIGNGQGRA